MVALDSHFFEILGCRMYVSVNLVILLCCYYCNTFVLLRHIGGS